MLEKVVNNSARTQRTQYLRMLVRTPVRALDLMVESTEAGVKEESKPSK